MTLLHPAYWRGICFPENVSSLKLGYASAGPLSRGCILIFIYKIPRCLPLPDLAFLFLDLNSGFPRVAFCRFQATSKIFSFLAFKDLPSLFVLFPVCFMQLFFLFSASKPFTRILYLQFHFIPHFVRPGSPLASVHRILDWGRDVSKVDIRIFLQKSIGWGYSEVLQMRLYSLDASHLHLSLLFRSKMCDLIIHFFMFAVHVQWGISEIQNVESEHLGSISQKIALLICLSWWLLICILQPLKPRPVEFLPCYRGLV